MPRNYDSEIGRVTEQMAQSPNIRPVLGNLLQIIPEQGCIQGCTHCSQVALASNIQRLGVDDLAVITGAVGQLYGETGVKNSFREIYPYKDNDPGHYTHLDDMALLMAENVGIPLRISTHGFSRSRADLTAMHERIVSDPNIQAGIGRTRLSFTPFAPAFIRGGEHRAQFERDMAHFLTIYKPLVDADQTFERSLGKQETKEVAKFGVFLRYKPEITDLPFGIDADASGPTQFMIGNEAYRVVDQTDDGLVLLGSDGARRVLRSYDNAEFFPGNPLRYVYSLNTPDDDPFQVRNFVHNPQTGKAIETDRVRYFTQARDMVRNQRGISDEGEGATWRDVDDAMGELEQIAQTNPHVAQDILPISTSMVNAYKLAGYSPQVFFNRGITKDAGIISNQGRASEDWRHHDHNIVEELPTNDREWRDLKGFRDREGLAFAIVPQGPTADVMGIDRIAYQYQPLGDPNLQVPITNQRVNILQEGNPRVGYIPPRSREGAASRRPSDSAVPIFLKHDE